jgi:hypothetical protein
MVAAMSERSVGLRSILVTYFPMFIATLSLCTSIFNGYLNMRFLNFIEHNTSRVEYMKTCKEIIDAYFQVKFRASLISAAGERARANGTTIADNAPEVIEGALAVNKIGALGTYLANLRDEVMREKYTNLTDEPDRIMGEARKLSPAELDKQYLKADDIFTEMNNDCVKSAKDRLM